MARLENVTADGGGRSLRGCRDALCADTGSHQLLAEPERRCSRCNAVREAADVADSRGKPVTSCRACRGGRVRLGTVAPPIIFRNEVLNLAGVEEPLVASSDRRRRARPRTRACCVGSPRPCPWVSCAYHLYLDVDPRTGALKLNFPGGELEELKETCALDVADNGGATLEEVGELLNVTRERVRQIVAEVLTRPSVRALVSDASPIADECGPDERANATLGAREEVPT